MIRSDIINTWLTENGHEQPLTDAQSEQMARFQARLLQVNQHMNLTAITDEQEIAVKHVIDSLSLLHWLPEGDTLRMLDIGAGAGFPGLCIKIVRPDIRVVLLDSLRKRIFFLRETADLLGLTGIECLHARAEEINRKPEYAGQFDLVTARAVARLNKLAGWALPFVKKGGLFLAMKGREVQAELEEARASIKKQGGLIKETREINISREITHTVVVIEKQ